MISEEKRLKSKRGELEYQQVNNKGNHKLHHWKGEGERTFEMLHQYRRTFYKYGIKMLSV